VPNPLKKLLAAALDGGVTPEEIGCQLEAVAVGRLVVEERKGLIQRVEPALLEEFCRMEPIVCGHLHRLHGLVDKVADQARSLREWFRNFVREHKGRPLTAKSLAKLEPLNRLLERDESFSRMVASPRNQKQSLQLQKLRRWRTPEALLSPIGEALAQFVCTEDFSNVKACEGPACTLLFADHTRGHARRWCSMAICGNRAKQAAHRLRLKAQH